MECFILSVFFLKVIRKRTSEEDTGEKVKSRSRIINDVEEVGNKSRQPPNSFFNQTMALFGLIFHAKIRNDITGDSK